jgi:hypothetical protein
MCDIVVSEEDKNIFIEKRLANKKKNKNKIAIVLVGGPGSGKSTEALQGTMNELDLNESDFVKIDPDEILTTLYNNNNKCYGSDLLKINNKSFTMAQAEGYNLVFDGTGKNKDWYIANVFNVLKNNNYKIYLTITLARIEDVLRRLNIRKEETGRTVDEWYVRDVYDKLDKVIGDYINMPCNQVNKIFLYDNTGSTAKLHLRTSCNTEGEKHIDCVDIYCETYIKKNSGGRKRVTSKKRKRRTRRKK